jgi:ribosomal protein S19E (S16A)
MTRKLRSTDDMLTSAVGEALDALGLEAEDSAVKRLARVYAAEIDGRNPEESVEVLGNLGPKLLATLEALGATPKARGKLGKIVPRGESELDRMRASRPA